MPSSGYCPAGSRRRAPSQEFALLHLQPVSVQMEVLLRPRLYSHPLRGLFFSVASSCVNCCGNGSSVRRSPSSSISSYPPSFRLFCSTLWARYNHSSHCHCVPSRARGRAADLFFPLGIFDYGALTIFRNDFEGYTSVEEHVVFEVGGVCENNAEVLRNSFRSKRGLICRKLTNFKGLVHLKLIFHCFTTHHCVNESSGDIF